MKTWIMALVLAVLSACTQGKKDDPENSPEDINDNAVETDTTRQTDRAKTKGDTAKHKGKTERVDSIKDGKR